MIGPVVSGAAVTTRIYFIGQAPGPREGELGKPFAWTAGKRLFSWFETLGVSEEEFRAKVYIAAVARCFPGKAKKGGGDRVPSREEVEQCAMWMSEEVRIIRPKLVIAVGRLAIEQVRGDKLGLLEEAVGEVRRARFFDHDVDYVALPHPSGLSSWHKTEPGKTLLTKALTALRVHEAWRATFE